MKALNGKKMKSISSSDNFLTPKYPNLYGKENWYDSVVAAISEDGDLFVWGQINGVVINTPLELGAGRNWSDVKVSDGILALAEDGTMHQLAIELYNKVPTSSNDTDNDGVADSLDAFKYNPQFQYDSDEDGLPDKEEARIGTDRFNEDSDKDENGNLKPDGVNDGEDAFPLDPRYSRDDDEDGVPYKLDFKIDSNGTKIFTDDNWDRDGDQIPDGEDANPDVYGVDDWDYDGDGISNFEEWERHLDAWNRDTDQDGIDDNLDEFPQSYFYQLDSDKDGLPDKLEIENGTKYLNPQTDWDSDGDGVKDGIDISKFDDFRNQADELYKNCSGDNWRKCNGYEFFWRFWDLKYDCDGNGRISREEWEKTSSDCTAQALRDDFPLDSNKITDTDRDGIDDNLDDDDDNDGYKDVFEEFEITINGEVLSVGTNPKSWWDSPERNGKDSDFDRVPDLVEIHGLTISNTLIYQKGTDPFNVNSDDDWAWDGWDDWPLDSNIQNDRDRDKLEDWVEGRLNTNPLSNDTDGDGVLDGEDDFPTKNWIIEPGKFSGTKDSDKDGLSDEYEKQNSTIYDYTKPDSDGDGYWDCECDENKFVYYTDFYGNSYWTDNWRWCNQEKENEYLTATDSDTLNESYRNKFIAAGIKTVREILDLNIDKIIEIVDFTGDNRFNDAYSLRRKLEIYLWGQWSYDIQSSEWVNSNRIKEDKFPGDPSETTDFDNDTIGDNSDPDIDNDGYNNDVDDLDFDPTENLNTDAPTIANGGLKDYNNNGIYGEDADGDGWFEEVDTWNFDFIGNNKDMDDDADKFLDVDEIASGTDPLDPDSYPGSGYGDSDKDGLSNAYEIAQKTDPKNWDTDGDGVSDGWIHPHICGTWNSNDYKVFIEIPNATATVNPDTYYIELNGNNQNWSGATRISYTVSTSINGTQLLNHFATELNKIGQITYDIDKIATYTATVSGNLLVITQGEQGRKFHFNAFNTVIGENNTIFLDKHDYDSHGWKSDLYVLPATTSNNIAQMCETHTFRYGLGGGKPGDNAEFDLLRDAFPNDPNEFWDTDGDGTGDKSDTDIDGDGILNSSDPMPFDSTQSLDTDGDGILDNIDPDDDNDSRLDVDEEFNSTDPLDSNSQPYPDTDGDGLSDSYELSTTNADGSAKFVTDPNDWDSDNDGISDGPFRKNIASGQNWNIRIDIPQADFSTIVGDEYYISINGHNQDYNDRLLVTFDGQTSKTGTELLEYFKTELNKFSRFLYDNYKEETFTASVSGTRLTIAGNDLSKSAHVEAFFVIPGADSKLVLVNHGWRHYWWKSDVLQQKDETCCGSDRFDGIGYGGHLFLMDAFPNDPNEFWDTDGDGIGDNSDTDIDGDGYLNENDGVPFDARDHLDTDNDGIGDSLDDNKDGDNFLDFDDPNPLVFTSADGGADADLDGFSDFYEISILKTDPNDWDTDNDGVSDGWKMPQIDYNQNWKFVITTVSDVSKLVDIGQKFEFRIWDHANWDGGKDLNVFVKTQMTAQQVLNSLRDKINNLGSISTNQYGVETFSASVDGNKLIIQGNDTQRNIGIEGSESLMNLDDKVIFTQRTWKWDQITRIFHSTRLQTITKYGFDKYFVRGGEVKWEDAGGQLLIDQFPLDPNEYWDTDGDGVA